jgi:hypothetical protein
MLLFVLVRPHADESERVTAEQIDAGQAWLEHHRDVTGVFALVLPFKKTGGIVLARIPDRYAGSDEDARNWLTVLFTDYPLLDTIDMPVVELTFEPLRDGFDVLREAHRRGVPTAEVAAEVGAGTVAASP